MKKRILGILPLLALLVIVVATWFYLENVTAKENGKLLVSGTVEAKEVDIASEISGKVKEVHVDEGQVIHEGDLILTLDDSLLQAQYDQAKKAVEVAEAGLRQAQANLELAELQYQKVLQNARLADSAQRVSVWDADQPDDFTLPVWYYTHDEKLSAAQAEVQAAEEAWHEDESNLERMLDETRYAAFLQAEQAVAEARMAYEVAELVLERAKNQSDDTLLDAAQEQFDAAKAALEAAQLTYEQELTTQEATEILDARAQVVVSRERYYTALDMLYQLQSGDHALDVAIANSSLEQARAAVDRAEKSLAQAQSQVQLIEEQLAKTAVYAPIGGVVLSRNIEPGEVVPAGVPFITLGQLDDLRITVYLPEDKYGVIRLGDEADVMVDSYLGEVFRAEVVRIAEKAEYTPRNVQTQQGRRTTVFAVELVVDDPAGKLKPGMPADVDFGH